MMTFTYLSALDSSPQTIKIDISMKSNLQLPAVLRPLHTIFEDKITEKPIFAEHMVHCMDIREAVAEKVRASLTRERPAIRDYFDLRFIKNTSDFDFGSTELKNLIDTKLAETDYHYTISPENYNLLEQQIQTNLLPVLNKQYRTFNAENLKEIYNFVLSLVNFKQNAPKR
jgi:hypothetical protein